MVACSRFLLSSVIIAETVSSAGVVLDFVRSGTSAHFQRADIVCGTFALEFDCPSDLLSNFAAAAKDALGDACPTDWPVQMYSFSNYLSDNAGKQKDRKQMRYFYCIIPLRGSHSCAQALYPAHRPVEKLMQLISWRCRQSNSLVSYANIEEWEGSMDPPLQTSSSVMYSGPPPPLPLLGGGDDFVPLQSSWAQGNTQENFMAVTRVFDDLGIGGCRLADGTARGQNGPDGSLQSCRNHCESEYCGAFAYSEEGRKCYVYFGGMYSKTEASSYRGSEDWRCFADVKVVDHPEDKGCDAFTVPCLCVAQGCLWYEDDAGSLCWKGELTNESLAMTCSACPSWPSCTAASMEALSDNAGYISNFTVDLRGDTCNSTRDPCACAGISALCRWNESAMRCDLLDMQWSAISADIFPFTPCTSCWHQEDCSPPTVVKLEPPSGEDPLTLPDKLKMTFDRLIRLPPAEGAVAFVQCDRVWRSIPRSALKASGHVFEVNIMEGVTNGKLQKCSLVLNEGIVEDATGMRYLGMPSGGYDFYLKDTMGPELVKLYPLSGSTGVRREQDLYVTFSEAISLGTTFRAYLLILGVGDAKPEGLDTSAMIVKEFNINSMTVRHSQERSLIFDLRSVTNEYGRTYSLLIAEGGVYDAFGNEFAGLKAGEYIFTTELRPRPTSALDMKSTGLVLVPIGIGAIVLSAIFIVCFVTKPWQEDRLPSFKRLRHGVTNKVSRVHPEEKMKDTAEASAKFRHSMMYDLGVPIDDMETVKLEDPQDKPHLSDKSQTERPEARADDMVGQAQEESPNARVDMRAWS
eukprot:TRINITY_DN92397_c0_g1_i1.p1 TRINITY_DN92397_c0_g1~~TRINITY_DN92397_c0_g1_i1.p1  ORF type:complete len:804 (+),score=108.69 TRINITY_DN92397_c0_g1_i1:13-2424(+)